MWQSGLAGMRLTGPGAATGGCANLPGLLSLELKEVAAMPPPPFYISATDDTV